MNSLRSFRLSVFILLVSLPALAKAPWKAELQQNLATDYRLTKVGSRGLLFDYGRVTEPGAIFVVRVAGIYADMANTQQAILKTTIRDGQAQQQHGFAAGLTDTGDSKQLKIGQTVYITRINIKDDAIEFELLTTDPVEYSGTSTRYRALVVIPFDRQALPTMSLADIKSAINPVFAPPEIANAVQSKTVKLGMSIDEVKGILGNPSKIVDLGPKQVFVYPDMKIIFMNSKVSDVQ